MNNNIIKTNLAKGVDGCYIPSHRFKTARVSITAYLPLDKQTSCPLSLACLLISNGCKKHPSPMEFSQRLDTLYGANLSTDTYKIGDSLAVRVGIVFIEDRYLPSPVFEECTQLLLDTFFEPATDEGGFLEGNFIREQRIQVEEIEGEINDKRTFSKNRLLEKMLEGDCYGLSVTGTKEQTEALTRKDVYDAWQMLLKTAHFRISVTADHPHDEVFDAFNDRLAPYSRKDIYQPKPATLHTTKGEVKQISDSMAVAQGKLAMGFSCEGGDDYVSYKTMVMLDVLGGGPYSLFFTNVREKLSLCYYCAARGVRKKGFFVVESGVEFDNMDKTLDAVLDQIESLKSGNFDDGIVDASKLFLTGSLKGIYDSQSVTDHWYADRWFDEKLISPEEMSVLIESVTKADVIAAAKSIKLDTVYRLLGK